MNQRPIYLFIFLFVGFSCVLSAEKIDEIKKYFELKETLNLVNLEMKMALESDSRSPMLADQAANENLTRLVLFLEDRIKDFERMNTPLKQYYIRHLNTLFQETRSLFAKVLVKMRSKLVNQSQSPVISEKTASATFDSQKPPSFKPLDIRALFSSGSLKKQNLKKAKQVWAKQMQENAAGATNVVVGSSQNVLFNKTPIEPLKPTLHEELPLPQEAKAEMIATQSLRSESVIKPVVEKKIEVVPPLCEQNLATTTAVVPLATATLSNPSGAAEFMRPLAIMIENHRKARPQSGLIDAELVYEIPVEGGITRFMAVFLHLPGVVGPIRSCREYFVERALEISALYVHCGGSPKGYAYLSKSKINAIDEIKHGKPFYRDNSRKAPHNLYSRGSSLIDYMQNFVPMRLAKQQLPLNYGLNPTLGSHPGTEIFIKYHGNYNTSYKYVNGLYERYMNGVKHIDRENGKHIAPGTVIIQTAKMKTIDSAGRQEINFIGSGPAKIFYRGTMIDGHWYKKDEKSITEYFDAQGKAVVFDKTHSIWIQVVSPNHKVVINGVDPEKNKEEKAADNIKHLKTKLDKIIEKS